MTGNQMGPRAKPVLGVHLNSHTVKNVFLEVHLVEKVCNHPTLYIEVIGPLDNCPLHWEFQLNPSILLVTWSITIAQT